MLLLVLPVSKCRHRGVSVVAYFGGRGDATSSLLESVGRAGCARSPRPEKMLTWNQQQSAKPK